MDRQTEPGRRPASLWPARLLAAVFLIVGLLFIAAPPLGVAIYGIETRDPAALLYVRAIGFRDIALALYIAGLAHIAARPALRILLGASLVIPACDIALVLSVAGLAALPQLLVHLAGAVALAAACLLLRSDDTRPHQG